MLDDHSRAPSVNPVLVELVRGGEVESRHRGAVAVVDVSGHVQEAIGDIGLAVYPRSAIKPLQALPLIESGAADAFDVSEEELALACASHTGEAMHTERIAAWLERIGCTPGDLVGDPKSPLTDNCSGKHAGFVTLAKHLEAPVEGYHKLAHPVQQRMLGVLEQMTGAEPGIDVPCGTDGCSVPTWAWPLGNIAYAWAQFAVPDRLPTDRKFAAIRLGKAMIAHPELVDGPGKFNSTVLRDGKGKILLKRGAEGVYCAGLPEYGLGIAIKIDDGADRAAERVMAAMLNRIGVAADCGADIPVDLDLPSRAGLKAGVLRAVGVS